VRRLRADLSKDKDNGHNGGPGFLEKLSHTPAFGRVKDEASNIGDAFVKELGKTATQVVLPALMTSIKNFIGGYLPARLNHLTLLAQLV
jgi:hypothetical protein